MSWQEPLQLLGTCHRVKSKRMFSVSLRTFGTSNETSGWIFVCQFFGDILGLKNGPVLQLSVNPDVDHKKWQKERFLLERYFFWTVQNVWLLQQRSTVGFEWPIVKYCFLVYCHDVEEKLVSGPNEVWSSSHTSRNYSWSITSRLQQLALLSQSDSCFRNFIT